MSHLEWHGLSFEDIDLRLCTSCGTCISACPVDALAWLPSEGAGGQCTETILFDREICIDCGICYAVCPPENPRGAHLPGQEESSQQLSHDPLIGTYTTTSRAYARDVAVRQAGSAGGVVTALLLSAQEQGLIDGAVVVASDPHNPSRPKVTVARTAEEIRAAAQSKYCLAPVNAVLDEIQHQDGPLAVVALPCQAHGLRLAQAMNLAITRKVVLVIGIFCGFNTKCAGTTYLLRKLGLHPDEVVKIEHRGGPWPGGFRAESQDGLVGFVPKHQYTYVHLMYSPEGCWYCPDLTAEFADLSVGDYWVGDAQAYSMVIERTATGQALLSKAMARHDIAVEPISYAEVLSSHRHLLNYKKVGVQVRRRISRRKPVEGYVLPTLTVSDWLGSGLFFGLLRFSSSWIGKSIIGSLPLRVTGLLSAKGREAFRPTNREG